MTEDVKTLTGASEKKREARSPGSSPHEIEPPHVLTCPTRRLKDTSQGSAGERVAAVVVVDDGDPAIRVAVDATARAGFAL